jgi:uncharacterized protein YidB (DUF937 family)
MGLLDDLGGGLKGALGQMLGQAAGQFEANALPGLLTQVLGNTQLGSVGGLLAKLQEGGLGGQVSSWLGNGSNMPIGADQLRAALGNEQVQQIANSLGLPTDKILEVLSAHLPGAIDQMSPNGTLEEPPSA